MGKLIACILCQRGYGFGCNLVRLAPHIDGEHFFIEGFPIIVASEPAPSDYLVCEACIRAIKRIPMGDLPKGYYHPLPENLKIAQLPPDDPPCLQSMLAEAEADPADEACPECQGDGKFIIPEGWLIDRVCAACGGSGYRPEPGSPPKKVDVVCCYCGEFFACECEISEPSTNRNPCPEEELPF